MPMPDAQIHPVATGKAIKTVEAHQDPQDLVFYSGRHAQPVIRPELRDAE